MVRIGAGNVILFAKEQTPVTSMLLTPESLATAGCAAAHGVGVDAVMTQGQAHP